MGDMLHQHRVVVVPLAITALVFAVVSVMWRATATFGPPVSPPRIAQAWFYDQNTGELFAAPEDKLGPLETSSGSFQGRPAGVRAVVFSCDACDEPDSRFVAWLEVPATSSNPVAEHGGEAEEDADEDSDSSWWLIRKPTDDRWYRMGSPQARRIMREANQICGEDKAPLFCHPPSEIVQ